MSGSITRKWSISNNWRTEFVLHKMHEIFSDDIEFTELNYSRIMMEASYIGSFLRNLSPEWILKLQQKLGSDELHEGYVNPVLDDDFFLSYQTVYDFVKQESLNLPEKPSYMEKFQFYQKYVLPAEQLLEEPMYLQSNLSGYKIQHGSLNADGIFIFVNDLPSEFGALLEEEDLPELLFRAMIIMLTDYVYNENLRECYATGVQNTGLTGQSDIIWRRGPEICVAGVYEAVKDWYNLMYKDPSVATAQRRSQFRKELTWGREITQIFGWDYVFNAEYPDLSGIDQEDPLNNKLNYNFLQKLKFHGDFVFAIPAAKEYLRCRDQGGLVEKFHIDRHFHGTLPRYASEDLQRLASQGYAFHGDDVFYLFGWDFYPNVNSTHTYVNSQFGKSEEDMLTSVELQNYIFKDVGAVIDLNTGLEIRATVYSEGDKIEVVEHLYRRELELWVKVTDEFTASIKNSDFIEMKAIAGMVS